MFRYFLLFIISLISISCQDYPHIDIFVESLCPDCQNFIKDSFAGYLKNPSYKELAYVEFIPYGNAKESKVGDRYEFTCQHGPNECYGNTVSNCALNKISYEEGLNFMLCFENAIKKFDKNINKSLKECVNGEDLYNNIINCAESSVGNNLQHIAAQKTPVHKYVPFIYVNGKHDLEVEKKILKDMNQYLCGNNKSLPGCEAYLNNNFLPYVEKNNKEISHCVNTFLNEMVNKVKKSLGL